MVKLSYVPWAIWGKIRVLKIVDVRGNKNGLR